MSHEIIEKLKKEIEEFKDKPEWESVGKVTEVGDGIVKFTGLRTAMSQELLTIESEGGARRAVALNLEEETVGALLLDDAGAVKAGDTVKGTGEVLSIEVGPALIGRVIDPLGAPLDGKGPIFPAGGGSASGGKEYESKRYLLETRAPGVLEREPVDTPLHTGLLAIDSMIPIGRGQRELIIGDRQTGKTSVALDAILNQKKDGSAGSPHGGSRKTPICVYVAIGQKEAKIARIVALLEKAGAMKYSVVVSAPGSSPASSWYLAPFAGCAVGEYFRDKGDDALVVYDDLSKHAWGYRQVSLLLRRPPGREAYPGDVFYLHSRLLERAARLSKEKGGGSLTALPIIETQLGDITAYVPTNVISITDGQIYLESNLFYQGVRPAVNVGLSVSRVGSAAQTKAMKKAASGLKLALSQFRELQAFVQFASDVDEATRAKIRRGQIITEILKQEDQAPLPFEKQVVLLYAALKGTFDHLEVSAVGAAKTSFMETVEKLHEEDILNPIRESSDMSAQVEAKLKEVMERIKNS
ncbi:MAG: F0F1 ATP synthase subunit alpha [Candidatus Liptonbacteria bacterium]|nr:F0F1 ATP synthase subunit alpha [Candidatus Liptonbacteria bacterium]